jgi:hypothetical protein
MRRNAVPIQVRGSDDELAGGMSRSATSRIGGPTPWHRPGRVTSTRRPRIPARHACGGLGFDRPHSLTGGSRTGSPPEQHSGAPAGYFWSTRTPNKADIIQFNSDNLGQPLFDIEEQSTARSVRAFLHTDFVSRGDTGRTRAVTLRRPASSC